MIDLHMHSMFSDGSYTPEELVEEASSLGLTAIALTDHDTTKGIRRFLQAASKVNLRAVPGVEIGTDYRPGTLDLLGYFIEPEHDLLNQRLAWIRGGREERNEKILDKLNALGLTLTWDEIKTYASDEVVGRPHFAQAMVACGYVPNKQQAFDRYLASGRPAYVERRSLSPKAGIELIRTAGGVPVLAHPFTLSRNLSDIVSCIASLREYGLEGLEVYYSEHSPGRVKAYLRYAKKFNLIPSGGSDFHGKMSPGISMGKGLGSLRVPDEVVDELESRRPIRQA